MIYLNSTPCHNVLCKLTAERPTIGQSFRTKTRRSPTPQLAPIWFPSVDGKSSKPSRKAHLRLERNSLLRTSVPLPRHRHSAYHTKLSHCCCTLHPIITMRISNSFPYGSSLLGLASRRMIKQKQRQWLEDRPHRPSTILFHTNPMSDQAFGSGLVLESSLLAFAGTLRDSYKLPPRHLPSVLGYKFVPQRVRAAVQLTRSLLIQAQVAIQSKQSRACSLPGSDLWNDSGEKCQSSLSALVT